MKQEFAEKEKEFVREIDQLNSKIKRGRNEAKETGAELSIAYATTQNEYPNLDEAQRRHVSRKDE